MLLTGSPAAADGASRGAAITSSRRNAMTQINPNEVPGQGQAEVERKDKSGVGRAVYVHSIATFGALLVFAGGFLAAFAIPSMVFPGLVSSRLRLTLLLVLGVLVGLASAALSYRATLRTYRRHDA
jgi:anti-sigma factor RsiW